MLYMCDQSGSQVTIRITDCMAALELTVETEQVWIQDFQVAPDQWKSDPRGRTATAANSPPFKKIWATEFDENLGSGAQCDMTSNGGKNICEWWIIWGV